MARRKSTPPVPVETPAGVGTVLPGVPLPAWALPAEPVAPEPPAPAPVPEPVPVAAYAAAAAAPEPAPWTTAPVADSVPAPALSPMEAPVPVLAPVETFAPADAAPLLAAPVAAAPLLDAPPPLTEPLAFPAPDGLTAPVALPEPPAGPTPHRHVRDDVVPEAPAKRRRFGRKGSAPADADAPLAEPLAEPLAAATAAAAAPVAAPAAAAPAAPVVPEAPAEEAGPRRSRRPLVLLLVLLVVAALGAVAAFVWPGLLVAPSDDGLGGAVAKPKPKPAAVTLQTPAAAGALQKIDGPAAQQLAAATAGTTLAGLTAPVSAVYGTAGAPAATVVAWTATTPPAATAVTDAFAGWVVAHGTPVTGLVDVAPGALGGQMRCGTSTVSGAPATVCFWADTATLGTVTVLAPATPQAGADTAAAIRQAVETKG